MRSRYCRTMQGSLAVLIGFCQMACAVSIAQAGVIHPLVREKVGDSAPGEEISVIVTLTDQVRLEQFRGRGIRSRRSGLIRALRDKAARTQKPLRKFLDSRNIGDIRPFWIFNGMAVTLPTDQVAELARQPAVKSLRLDTVHSLPSPLPASPAPAEWNLEAIHAPVLWDIGYTGTGVVIAGMDTGVDPRHHRTT